MSTKRLNWVQETRNFLPILTLDLFMRGMKQAYIRKMGFNYKHFKKVRDKSYKCAETNLEFQEKVRQRARKEPGYIRRIIAMQYRDFENLVAVCRHFERDFSKSTIPELKKCFLELVNAHFECSCGFFNVAPFGDLLGSILKSEISKRVREKDRLNNYLSILSTPLKETETAKSQKELLRIALMKRPSPKQIMDYIRDYGWLNVKLGYGRPFTKEQALERIKAMRQGNPEKQLGLMEAQLKEAVKKREEVIKELGLDSQLSEIAALASENAYFRTYRLEAINKAGYYATPLYNEIAKRIGTDYDSLFFMTIGEIISSLDIAREVEKRKKCLGYLHDDGRISIYTEENIREIEEKEQVDLSKRVFIGIPASKGRATGPASIVSTKSEIAKVKNADIMVAEFTTPDFMPAIEKAAAIVTDLGGLTSHSAVIARELGKPCIVGTGDASKVIKDGEKVYVDADQGMVRRIIGMKKISSGDYKVALVMWMFLKGGSREQEKIIGYGHKNALVVFNNLMSRFYMDPKEIEELGQIVIEKLNKDPALGSKVISQHIAAGKELLRVAERIYRTELAGKTDNELCAMLKEYLRSFARFSGFHIMPVTLEKEIAKKVMHYLEQNTKDPNEAVMLLTALSRDTNMITERKDLLRIAIEMKKAGLGINDSRISMMIDEHARKYEWMGVTQEYTPYTRQHFAGELLKAAQKGPEAELNLLTTKPKQVEEKRQMLLEELKLPAEIRLLVDVLREFAFTREFKRDTGYKSHYFMEKFWREIAKRARLEPVHIRNCTPYELIGFLSGKAMPSRQELDERLRYQVIAMLDGKIELLTGEKARALEEAEAIEESAEGINEVKGMPACKGKARGIVKVLLKPGQIGKVSRGDIIVAVNTEPAMVPAMRRAAAIVTDEGGITCHAAIVSRELGIPCVIGTKIATKVFKDGDIAEVDANKGIVRRIAKG